MVQRGKKHGWRNKLLGCEQSLIDLGPTFIKIGQALGTRADLLPLAYVKELATLQDNVPAFPTADAFARIEAELGRNLHEFYPEIDSEPIASASLGQVYRARLTQAKKSPLKFNVPISNRPSVSTSQFFSV